MPRYVRPRVPGAVLFFTVALADRRWEHHIRDETDLVAHVRYRWWNPVKHGLAGRAVDWPCSSIHRDIHTGKVDAEWTGAGPDGAFGKR